MDDKKIYLDENGYNEYLRGIEDLKVRLKINSRDKAEAGGVVNEEGMRDNFDFEQAEIEQRSNLYLLNEMVANFSKIVLIYPHGDSDLVDLDDYINVDMCVRGKPAQSRVIKLTGLFNPKIVDGVREVTVNSPIGKAVYRQKVGAKISYVTDAQTVEVVIKNKSKNLNDLDIKTRR